MNWYKRAQAPANNQVPANPAAPQLNIEDPSEKIQEIQKNITYYEQQIQLMNTELTRTPNAADPADVTKHNEALATYPLYIKQYTDKLDDLNREKSFLNAQWTNNQGRTGNPYNVQQTNPDVANLWNKDYWGNPFTRMRAKNQQRWQQQMGKA